MTRSPLHSWDLTAEQARALQRDLAQQVVIRDLARPPERIAGVDVAYAGDSDEAVAAAVVLDAATLAPIDQAVVTYTATFAYTPGLFSFREAPALIAALDALTISPDLVICDGHGIAHPRRFGLASHVGVLLDLPTIGCAKGKLHGQPAPAGKPVVEAHQSDATVSIKQRRDAERNAVGPERGDRTALVDNDETIGWILRTQTAVNPVYVSPGHRVGLEQCCDLTLACAPTYRLPETTRAADQLVRQTMAAR